MHYKINNQYLTAINCSANQGIQLKNAANKSLFSFLSE